MVLLKEISDSAQAITARSQKITLVEIQNWLTLRGVEFFEVKNRIPVSSRKRIFQQNHFSLFIRGPGWLDSKNKKIPKNLVTAILSWISKRF